MNFEYTQLDQVRHMLQHPERDLGDTTISLVKRGLFDISKGKIDIVEIPYNTALERLYLEILYNAVDNVERSRIEGIDPGVISVDIDATTIRIRNEGRPISCKLQPGRDIHIPEFLFSSLLTGSNFGGNKRKVQTVGGKFGIGCKATNIFSIYFHVEIGNEIEKTLYSQTWRNNMYANTRPEEGDTPEITERKRRYYREKVQPKITPYNGPSYTQITFVLDFARFYDEDTIYGFSGKRQFSQQMIRAFAKHCADASLTAHIPVFFNKQEIYCSSKKEYVKLYYEELPRYVEFESEDSSCIFLDTPGEGNTISFVNGVINEEGGIHVDTWCKAAFSPLVSKLKTQYKGFKVTEKVVREHISLFLLCRLSNPKYKSQTKDKVTSPKPKVCSIPKDTFYSWDAMSALETLGRKHNDGLASKTDGTKVKILEMRKLMDAANAGGNQSHLCTLYITEGDGAAHFAVKGIDDGGYTGALPLKGKLLNVSASRSEQYASNEEIAEIKKALGLREGFDYSNTTSRKELRYGRCMIMTDQDADGAHIRMLILNFFRLRFPSLLKETTDGQMPPFLAIMETPYVRLTYGRRKYLFFSEKEYIEWRNQEEERKKVVPKYYKGLGSSSDEELLEAFRISKITVPVWDKDADKMMSLAFDEDNADWRKLWLNSWDPEKKISSMHQDTSDTVTSLITNSLCEFAYINAQRSIPSLVDGLKECQRKVMNEVLQLSGEKKVSQLKGIISDKMHYRYGDNSLEATIVNLGNYYAGSNNIPLIEGKGQYKSRLGKKAAADRYLAASRPAILKYIFRKEDNCILSYKYEGKDRIEPYFFYPIIPLWAVNGSKGIGTGYSTNIPLYSPGDIIAYISWWLKSKMGMKDLDPPVLKPWYRNYQGEIKKIGEDWYSVGSYEIIPSRKRVKDVCVTELPVTMSISSYLKKLDILKEKPIIKNWPEANTKSPTYIGKYKSIPKKISLQYKGKKYIEILPYIHIENAVCLTAVKDNGLRSLGLIEKISDTNITLLDEHSIPTLYGSKSQPGIENALNSYCRVRYDAYVQRREIMCKQWKKEIEKLELEIRFITDIIEKKITFEKSTGGMKSKAQLSEELQQKGYPEEFGNRSLFTCTEDGIESLRNSILKLQEKYNFYQNTSPGQIWLNELKELYNQL